MWFKTELKVPFRGFRGGKREAATRNPKEGIQV